MFIVLGIVNPVFIILRVNSLLCTLYQPCIFHKLCIINNNNPSFVDILKTKNQKFPDVLRYFTTVKRMVLILSKSSLF